MPAPAQAETARTGADDVLIIRHSDYPRTTVEIIVSRYRIHRPDGGEALDERPTFEPNDVSLHKKPSTDYLQAIAVQRKLYVNFPVGPVRKLLPGRVADATFHDLIVHHVPLTRHGWPDETDYPNFPMFVNHYVSPPSPIPFSHRTGNYS